MKYLKLYPYYKRAISGMNMLAGAKSYVFDDGAQRGTRAVDVSTGTGFTYTILLDRGMDIGEAVYCGIPLAYVTKAGIKNNALCRQGEFHKYFFAGLLTTCGIDNVGGACEVDGKQYDVHGSRGLLPANNVSITSEWEGDQYVTRVNGKMRMAELFGENISMKREIVSVMGQNEIIINDSYENESSQEYEYLLMYHFNFGFPIVSEHSKVSSNHKKVTYFDDISAQQKRNHRDFTAPQKSFHENVFVLEDADKEIVTVKVYNPKIGLGMYVECCKKELPCFTQWVNLREQDYVLGLEPGTVNPIGRKEAKEKALLKKIDAGQKDTYCVKVGLLNHEG